MLKIKKDIEEMYSILEDIASADENIKSVFQDLDLIDARYQKGTYDYAEYNKLTKKITSGKSRSDLSRLYSNYILNLKNKLLKINSKILRKIYSDKSYEKLTLGKKTTTKKTFLPSLETLEVGQFESIEEEITELKEAPVEIKPPKPKPIEKLIPPVPTEMNFFKRLSYIFSDEKPWIKEGEDVKFGGLFTKAFFNFLFSGDVQSDRFIGDTKILPTILSYETAPDTEWDMEGKTILNPHLLEKQIQELKSLISKKKPEIYKANFLGYIANITIRRLSIYLIEKYPEFFNKLYKAIRRADMKMLANTYINIIIFISLILGIITIPIFIVIFTLQGDPFIIMFLKTLLSCTIALNLGFWGGYYYPFNKEKSRKRSVNTNLPFAIDHMSSVIASGVSPAIMFKLISHSEEYGEISVEIRKVTNYIEFFGYDIMTAMKAVALNTPSDMFKEFIDGFVSTIETGGDLKTYLSQQSSEALLNYRLERQKYVESLSTYSDIYTGVLIAAPLFFVIALSLVSVLGGQIGGMDVNTIIALGTYLVIPGLNLLFIVFLELNQPEV